MSEVRRGPIEDPPAAGRRLGRPRAIGGAIPGPETDAFLALDPAEGFDLVAVNAARLPSITRSSGETPEVVRAIADRTDSLMSRVRKEEDDPLSVGSFLRDRVLEWYTESASAPEWATIIPRRWGGMFAESRAPGGHRIPWLNARLSTLRASTARGRRLGSRIRTRLSRDRALHTTLQRSASQQINAEVAQAILDDLAAHPRSPGAPAPLVRLSELAVRRQVATVNDSLAAILSGPESGPFVVLHPNRYPGCEELLIRTPGPGSSGAALAYSLAPGRPVRRGGLRPASSEGPTETAGARSRDGGSESDEREEIDASTVWDAGEVGREDWVRVVGQLRRERGRLDAPPKDYRARAAYGPLRDLALADPEFRKAFLAAKWRGRPAGLPLLVVLLQKGSFEPEVATDPEYLEAELGELAKGDPQWRPPDGIWALPGWTISREGSRPSEYRYRADAA